MASAHQKTSPLDVTRMLQRSFGLWLKCIVFIVRTGLCQFEIIYKGSTKKRRAQCRHCPYDGNSTDMPHQSWQKIHPLLHQVHQKRRRRSTLSNEFQMFMPQNGAIEEIRIIEQKGTTNIHNALASPTIHKAVLA
jgi:hypothetical protein